MPGRNGLCPDTAQWRGKRVQRPRVLDAIRLTPDAAKQADGSLVATTAAAFLAALRQALLPDRQLSGTIEAVASSFRSYRLTDASHV
jgi:hypothetical protein